MTKKQSRQNDILGILKNQGTGVISMSNEQLGVLLSVSPKTVQRDITEMHDNTIIVRETKLVTIDGNLMTQRDIILKGEPQRRFSISQHNNLRNVDNHKVEKIGDEWTWFRKPNGIDWEVNMPDKEFNSEKQIWSWIYTTMAIHHKKYINGDSYKSRND